MYETVSKEKAKELIDEAPRGVLVVVNADLVPTIGDFPLEDRQISVSSDGYRFADPDIDFSEGDL